MSCIQNNFFYKVHVFVICPKILYCSCALEIIQFRLSRLVISYFFNLNNVRHNLNILQFN